MLFSHLNYYTVNHVLTAWRTVLLGKLYVKVKGKVHTITCREDPNWK